MRIALFTETFLPKIDGIVTRLKNTIEELRRQGDQVLVFAPGEGITEYEGAEIVRSPGMPFPLYPELTIALPRSSIRRKLLEFKPDLIHVADPAILGLAGLYYGDVLHVPLVASYHTQIPKYVHYYGFGATEGLVWTLMRARHNRANLNLCTSTAMFEELRANGIERVRLWPPAVNTELFHPRFATSEMRCELAGQLGDAPLFLYVGRLSAEKEIEKLRCIFEAMPGARLAIVGGGPHRGRLESYFAGTATHFAGYMTGQRLAAAMGSVDALILPSRTETLGLVLIEAMAAGSVVVGARAGGVPDLVDDGVTGFMFNPDEPGDLKRVVQRVARDSELMKVIRDRARQKSEEWNWAASTAQLRRFYEEAIATPRKEKSALANAFLMQAMKRTMIGGIKVFLG